MLKGLKLKFVFIALLLVGAIAGMSFALTTTEGVFTSVTVPDPLKLSTLSSYLQYTISQDSLISINVYAEDGTLIRTLSNNVSKLAGNQSIPWDGKDLSGTLVPDGRYRFYFEAKDTSGNIVGQVEKFVIAARQPAITNVSDTPDPFNPLINELAEINYNITSDALVSVSILKGTTPVRTLITNQLTTAGTHSFTWDGKDDNGNLISDAVYTYQIDAVSPMAAQFKATYKNNTTLEKDAPQINAFNVTPNPFKIGVNSLSINYSLSESAKVTIKVLDSDGNIIQTVANGVAKSAGTNSSSWNGKDSAGVYVPEGTYNVIISAVDNFNKPSLELTKSFTAGYQPAISNVTDIPNPFNPVNGGPVVISYNISRDANVTVSILKGTTSVRTITTNQFQTAGDYSFSWDGKDDAGNLLSDAVYTYQIEAASPTVETFKSTYKSNVTLEKDNPQISAFNVTPNPLKLVSSTLSISYNLSETSKVTIKVLDSTGNIVQTIVNGISKNSGANTNSWNGKDALGNYVPEGVYTIVISATDNFNNISGEQSRTITAGYNPAISGVSIINSPFNPLLGEETQVTYATSKDSLVTLSIIKGSTIVRNITTNELKIAGTYSFNWDGRDNSGVVLDDGNYTFQIDAASPTVSTFKSTYKGTVTLEAREPAVTGISITPTIVKLGYSSTIKYSLSEAATVDVQILDSQSTVIRNFAISNKTASGTYSFSWDGKDNNGTLVTSGEYIIKITATDNYNKSTTGQLNFSAGEVPIIMNAYADPDTADAINNISAKIYYRVSEKSLVTIKVYDINNKLINTLANSKEVLSSDSVEWDGSDSTGLKTEGTYTFKIDAFSAIGNFKAQQATGTVKVSNIPTNLAKCVDCHKNYPAQHPVQKCSLCHSDSEGPIENCAGCHTTSKGHTDGSVLTNYSCNYCHNDTYDYKIPIHPVDNDGLHSKPFNMQACSQCHQTSITKEHANIPVPTGQNSCDLCHASVNSNVQKAIVDKNLNCSGCHVVHSVAGVDHTNPAYTGLPKDLDMSCSQCHSIDISNEHTGKQDANGINYTCDTCHGSEKAEVKLAITNKDKNCEACHIDTATQQPNVHTSSGSPIHDTTFILNPDLDCINCHSSNNKVEHMDTAGRTTADGQPITCATCHSSNNPLVLAAISSNNNRCTACHTYPTAKHQANHTASIFTGNTSRTDLSTCSLCHIKSITTEHMGKTNKAGTVMDCNTCHSQGAAENVKAAIASKNSNCEACHTIHDPKPALTQHNSTKTFVANEDVSCTNCHQRNIKTEHIDKATVVTTDGQPITCDTCHASTNTSIQSAIVNKDDQCSACHAYPTTKHQPTHKTNIYTSDPTRTEACNVCHVTTNLVDSHVGIVNSKTNETMTCNTCHTSATLAVINAIQTKQTNSCEACHLIHQPKSTKEIHDTNDIFAATTDTDCVTCHDRNVEVEHIDKGKTINGVAMTCESCHSSTKPEVVDAIKTKNSRCDACHPAQPTKHSPAHNATVLNSDTTRTDKTTCILCHTKSLTTEHLNKTSKSGVVMDCKTCHSTNVTANVKTAVESHNDNCEACHTTHGPKTAVTEHNSTNGYLTDEDVSCTSCHDRNNKLEHMDNPLRTTSDGQPIACDTCHGSTNPKVLTAFTNKDDKCSACHTYPTTKHQPKHQTNIYTTNTIRTDAKQCSICHKTANLVDLHVGVVDSKTNQSMTCNTCHASTTPAVVAAISTKQTESCEACHIIHDPKPSSAVHDTADIFQATMNTDCATCHARNVETEHITKGRIINGVVMDCDSCHSSTNPQVINAINSNNTRCDACHNPQPTKHNPTHIAVVLNSDTTRTDQTTCAICHTKSLTTEHMNKTTKSGTVMDCKTCHSSTATENVKAAITNNNDNCEACHTTHVPKLAVTEHNSSKPYIPSEDVSCISCHDRNIKTEHLDKSTSTTASGQPINCDTCHGSADTKVTTAITNKDDSCNACHTYQTNKHQPVHKTNIYTSDASRPDINECSICHTTTNLVDSHVGVVYSQTQQPMTCNTCHTSTTPAVVAAIATKQAESCEACHIIHDPKSMEAIHDTSDVFVPNMDTDCASCHNRNVATEHVNQVSTTGVTMTCQTCHESTKPEVINAIKTNNLRCDACHTYPVTSPMHDPKHVATNFTGDTTRTDLTTCTLCHTKALTDEHVNKLNNAGQTMTCNTCHSSTASTQIKTAISSNNDECEACHTVHAPKPAISQHDSIKPYVASEDVNCSNCHNRNIKTEHIDKSASTTASGQPISCDTCHGSGDTKVQTALVNKDDSCSACHTYPTAKHQPTHKTTIYTNDTTRSDANSCSVCHTTTNLETLHIGIVDSKTNQPMTCNTCHASTNLLVVNAIATKQTNSCEACHLVHAPKAGIHATTDDFVTNMDTNCASCHARDIEQEHVDKVTSTGTTMTCKTCHESTNTEVVNAISNNNNRCDACHAYPTTKHQPTHNTNIYTTDTTRSDANACSICHTTTNLETLHVGVVDSKTNQPMTCNTCHASTNLLVVNAIATKQTNSCEACHLVHAPKAGIHETTDVFAVSMDTDCASCHSRNVETEHVDKVTSTGVTMTCQTCHESAKPEVINAISTNNTRCDACHTVPTSKHNPTHTASALTSDTTRTDLTTCALCHTKSLTTEHVDKVNSTGVTMTCNTCHSSTASTQVKTAISSNNDDCDACHTVHVPKAAVSQHDSLKPYVAAEDVSCSNCHNRNIKIEHLDNSSRTTASGQPITCDSCHGSADAKVQAAISNKDDQCSACHAYPTTKHQPLHTTNIYTTDTARTDDCSRCHVKSLGQEHLGKTHTNGSVMDCNTCHASTNSLVVDAIKTKNTSSCEACHIVHPPKDIKEFHDSVNFTNNTYNDPNMNCSNCHVQYLNLEHVNKTTEAGVTMTCETCHSNTRADVQTAIATNNKKCEACHTKVHTSTNPYHATTFVTNPTMDCARCHNQNNIADDHMRFKDSNGQLITCATCHNSANPTVINAIRTNKTGCDTCHTSRHTDIQTPHKTTYIPVTSYDCSACHLATATNMAYNFTTAYHKIASVTPTNIDNLDGGSFISPITRDSVLTCRDCHDKNPGTGLFYGKLLKGNYNNGSGTSGRTSKTELCFNCHTSATYAAGGTNTNSGFTGYRSTATQNLHLKTSHANAGCQGCHTFKPHSYNSKHFIAVKSATEVNSRLASYQHNTIYVKTNCTMAAGCHGGR